MRAVKQTWKGYVDVEEGAYNPSCTHVILEAEEYRTKQKKLLDLKEENERLEQELQQTENKIQEQNRMLSRCRSDISEKEDEIEKYKYTFSNLKENMAQTEEQIEELNIQYQSEKARNEGLERITRERANAKRNITPKKEHDGYLVLRSEQWVEQYVIKNSRKEYDALSDDERGGKPYVPVEHHTAIVWRSVLQTCYETGYRWDEVEYAIEQDIWEGGILSDIGCPRKYAENSYGDREDLGDLISRFEENILYKWCFRANYVTGFWEIDLYTSKGLTVPPERMPVFFKKNAGYK